MADVSLFLHSTGTTPALWDSVPADLVGGARKLAPANLGYPPHPPLPRGDPCDLAREVAHLLAQIPPDASPLHLYAHSYGGLVALALLPHLGPRVRSLFLYEPVLFGALGTEPGAEAAADLRAFRDHPWFLDDGARGGTDPWLELFIDYWNRPGSFAAMPAPMKEFLRGVGWKMFQEVRSCFGAFESFRQPALDGVFTTVAMGSRSPRASRAMAQALARVNPGVHLLEVQGTGHMAPITHAPLVHEALRRHAADRARASAAGSTHTA